MRRSILSVQWFGFFLLLVAGTVGCAQSGTGIPSSLTAPSSRSVGVSAPALEPAALGPGASYDASGEWEFRTNDIHGNPVDSPFNTCVSQDQATGNLSFLADGDPATLERLSAGTGEIITYRLFGSGPESGTECDVQFKGTARLDTTTSTMTLPFRLKELGCSNQRVGWIITATRLSSSCS